MDKEETKSQKRTRIERRNRYRNSVCFGCRHNFYNFPSSSGQGYDVKLNDDYSCWYVDEVKRGKCPMYSKGV